MSIGNKGVIFNGSEFSDIICFSSVQSNFEIMSIFLFGIFIALLIVLLKARFPKDLSFLSASVTTFCFAVILFLGQTELSCTLIGERTFILITIIMLGSIIIYKLNDGTS